MRATEGRGGGVRSVARAVRQGHGQGTSMVRRCDPSHPSSTLSSVLLLATNASACTPLVFIGFGLVWAGIYNPPLFHRTGALPRYAAAPPPSRSFCFLMGWAKATLLHSSHHSHPSRSLLRSCRCAKRLRTGRHVETPPQAPPPQLPPQLPPPPPPPPPPLRRCGLLAPPSSLWCWTHHQPDCGLRWGRGWEAVGRVGRWGRPHETLLTGKLGKPWTNPGTGNATCPLSHLYPTDHAH